MAADQGFIQAQHNLRLMYYGDQGVAQDYSAAMKWYRMAADQGHAQAQCNLELMYRDGQHQDIPRTPNYPSNIHGFLEGLADGLRNVCINSVPLRQRSLNLL